MPTYIPPKKNTEFIFYVSLPAIGGGTMQNNPTIASGDFIVSTDGGSTSNLDTIPAVTPASSDLVKITLSATEMNGDNVSVIAKDAAGDEWQSQTWNVQTAVTQIDDLGDAIGSIANVGAAVNRQASSYVLTTGTQSSGTVSSTEALDGTNHEHTDATNVMDLYYEFLIGDGVPTSCTVTGYLNSNNDDLEIYGYDWVAASFKRIGTLNGKNASANEVNVYTLFVDMVGSGADLGKVRVQFKDGAFTLSSATLAIDQIFVSFSQGIEGYEDGRVWIDTTASNTNTVVGIDGTARNPVSTIAAAVTLSASTNLNRYQIAPGSSITLATTFTNYSFAGDDWTLALGGQDVTGSHFHGANVSGTLAGSGDAHFEDCELGAITSVADTHFVHCDIAGNQTLPAGEVFYVDCSHAQSTAPQFDFGSGVGTTTLHLHKHSGAVDFRNIGQSGTDIIHMDGAGKVTLNSNCTGGTLNLRGNFELADSSATTTINDDGNMNVQQVNAEVLDVMNTDTFAAPTGAPPSTDSLVDKIGFIYMALRNKVTVTSTSKAFFDDASSSQWSKTLSDNGTTYQEDEGS